MNIREARAGPVLRRAAHHTREQTAWAMYTAMGFERIEAIDFRQGTLEVFGFRLDLTRAPR